MLHAREDYNAIQPWPTKRQHNAKVDENGELSLALDLDENDLEDIKEKGNKVLPLIPDDEPVFLIRATDSIGPMAIRYWADLANAEGAEPRLVNAVREWADKMESYAGTVKTPDTPPGLLHTEN